MDQLSSRRPALDVLRAVAALGVVFGHAGMLANAAHSAPPGIISFVAQNGWKGIYLFFAISGYLIARPFVRTAMGMRRQVGVRDYARRRAARILPAHWLALTAMVLLLIIDATAIPRDFTVGRYAAHLFLVQNFVPNTATTILPVTWTLGLEAIFYVSVPVLFHVATGGGRRTLSDRRLVQLVAAVWVAGGAVMYLDQGASAHLTWWNVVVDNALAPTVGYLFFFAPGVLLAILEARLDRGFASRPLSLGERSPSLVLVAAVALWVAAGALDHVISGPLLSVAVLVCDALLGGAAVLAAVTGLQGARFPRPLIMLGEASYGIYLWHWIVANILLWLTISAGVPLSLWANQTLDWVVLSALTFPIAWLSWTRVERPAMLWARRHDSSAVEALGHEAHAVATAPSVGHA